MVEETQHYAARCFIMVPLLDESEKFNIQSVEEQIMKLASYCNANYATNYMKFIREQNKSYGLKERTFGIAKDGGKIDKVGGLTDYVRREHCVNFILDGLHRCDTFYHKETELAEKLMKPPYERLERDTLGYPRLK